LEDPSLVDVQAVKSGLQKYNLGPIICGAFGPSRDLTHEDPAVHRNCFAYIESCLETCAGLNTSVFAGPMYSAGGKARMLSYDKRKAEWDLAVKNLRVVCDMRSEE